MCGVCSASIHTIRVPLPRSVTIAGHGIGGASRMLCHVLNFASLHYIEWVAQRAIVEWRTIQEYARQVNRMEKKQQHKHIHTHTTHSQMNCALFGFGLEKLCSK